MSCTLGINKISSVDVHERKTEPTERIKLASTLPSSKLSAGSTTKQIIRIEYMAVPMDVKSRMSGISTSFVALAMTAERTSRTA